VSRSKIPEREELEEMGKTMSRLEIANSFGVSPSTLSCWFKTYGLPKPIKKPKFIDLTGHKFGRLTALYPSEKRDKGGCVRWVCSCSCSPSVRTEVRSSHLISLETTSCGCAVREAFVHPIDITGFVSGRLTAIRPTNRRYSGSVIWETRCSCGNTSYVTASNIKNKRILSCGCLAREIASSLAKDRVGPLSNTWNPDLTEEERQTGRNYPEYREWRTVVYERDNYTCQACGEVGGNLNAHHIDGYAKNPGLRTTLENGATLCKECHKDFHHQYGNHDNTREQFEEWMSEKDE